MGFGGECRVYCGAAFEDTFAGPGWARVPARLRRGGGRGRVRAESDSDRSGGGGELDQSAVLRVDRE